MKPIHDVDPSVHYARPPSAGLSIADQIFLVEQQAHDTRLWMRSLDDELSHELRSYDRDATPGPSQLRLTPPKAETNTELPYLNDKKGKSPARMPEKTFEDCLAERHMPEYQVQHISAHSPMVIMLREDQLHVMAAACRYAAQTSQQSGSQLSALATSVSALAQLPERQKPPGAYLCELKWHDSAPIYRLNPHHLQRD